MKKLLLPTLAVFALVPLTGCHLLLYKGLRAHAYSNAIKAAPSIPNPAKTGEASDAIVVGSDGTAYKMTSFSEKEMCFDARFEASPAAVQSQIFEISALKTADDDRDTAPKLTSAGIKVLNSKSEQRPVMKRQRDEVKDGSGRVLSYVEYDVQRIETFYETDARICFKDPKIVTADTTYLVMAPQTSGFVTAMSPAETFTIWRLE